MSLMPRGIYLHRSPSLATRVSMSESHKGHQTTQNTRDSISKANKGREPWNKGMKMSPEIIKKYSDGHLGIVGVMKDKNHY